MGGRIGCFLALGLLAGCAAPGPSLRALNPREAKIDVYPTGEVRVFGEPIVLGDLSRIVRRSDTEEADTVLIRLHGDPDSPELLEMQRLVTDQMIRGGHYKCRFFSTPRATVSTIDPKTGKAETYVAEKPVEILSGAAMDADIDRLAAEREAYANGTYASEAANRRPVAVGDKPADLAITPGVKAVAPQETPAAQEARPAARQGTPANASQEALREAWKRQQRQRRVQ